METTDTNKILEAGIVSAFERTPAETVLRWALDSFTPQIALACSFQAEESVLIDMMHRLRGADFRVFTLDTGRLNQETYDCMDAIRARYSISIEVYFPDALDVQTMVRAKGLNLFYNSVAERQLCCAVRKVAPLKRALSGLNAWLTGMRRDQAVTRGAVSKIELDGAHGDIIKVNPLADWSHDQVWQYIRERDIPFNRLHNQGYPSIGCAPCTRAVKAGEELRAGRWWWEDADTKECGLHVKKEKVD